MKLYLTKCMAVVCLAIINCQVFSQVGFRELRRAAWDSNYIGKHYSALLILQRAEKLQGVDTGFKPAIYLDLGNTHKTIGNIDSSIVYYAKAYKYVKHFYEKKDWITLTILYNRLGNIEFHYTENFPLALDYFKKEMDCNRMLRDTVGYFDCLNEIGLVYKRQKKYDSALHYCNLILSNPYADVNCRIRTIWLIADVHSLTEKYDKAMNRYDEAIQQLVTLKDTTKLFTAYNNKGDCLRQQKRFNESLSCFKQAEQCITTNTSNQQKATLYHNFADAYSHTQNYSKALLYKNMEANITDSLNAQNIEEAAAEAKASLQIEVINNKLLISEKERSITNLESKITKTEIRDTKRALYAIIIGAVVICLIAFLALRNAALRRKANRILTAQKAKVEALADKLEEANQTKARLFSVISHDLRSPVSSLYASLKMQELKGGNGTDNDATSSHIMHLLDTLEDLLTWSKSQMDRFTLQPVTLRITDLYADLIELNQDAAAAKQITITNKTEWQVKIHTDENLLKTILRNVLANSIHHAPNKSMVVVEATNDGNSVVCTISNEATATDAAMLEAKLQTADIGSSKHGLGNVLIKEFTEKLNADFEVAYKDGNVHILISVPNLKKEVTTKTQPEITVI